MTIQVKKQQYAKGRRASLAGEFGEDYDVSGGAMLSLEQKFIRLLELEIESMHDEVELILQTLDQRLARHEITDYVRNENGAILRNELLGLESFVRESFAPQIEEDACLDDVVRQVRESLRARCSERGYVPALFHLIDRRIEKIRAYLDTARSPVASS
jgi:hypothetical protein